MNWIELKTRKDLLFKKSQTLFTNGGYSEISLGASSEHSFQTTREVRMRTPK